MSTIEEVLAEIKAEVKSINQALYGRSPTDKGDIPEIKDRLYSLNNFKSTIKGRVIRLEVLMGILVSASGITKIIGVW